MRTSFIVCLFACSLLSPAQAPPAGIRVSTWVREDIFAGFMANDMDRFRQGERKLAALLSENPDSPDALSWRAGADLYLATQAHAKGDAAEAGRLHAKALANCEHAHRAGAAAGRIIEAVHAISGATWTYFAPKLPPALQSAAYQHGREHFLSLRQIQAGYWDKLPLHMKGELLAGLAESAARLGLKDDADASLKEIIATLPSSPYAARAQKWQDNPALAAKSSLTCMTCHEPGRLQNVTPAR